MTLTDNAAGYSADLHSRSFHHLIAGQLVDGSSTQPVIDPATGEAFATAPVANAAQIDAAVEAAAGAFKTWQTTTLDERADVVRAIADAIEARREEIATIITLETGKPIQAAHADVEYSLIWARAIAESKIETEVLRDEVDSRIEVHHKPLGVVVAIVPWNFPFFQSVYKLAPALLAGNTVILKPAPTTPLSVCILGEIVAPLVPPGVVNVLGDAGEVGPQLTAHPSVAKVSFTGSTAVGRKIIASGAETLTKTLLELGGNDSAIVMDDADVEKVANEIFPHAFGYSGQVCISIKRIFVHSSQFEAFADAFSGLARAAKVGPGIDPETEIGPIQNARQFETVKGYLEQARKDGTIIAGGELIDGNGYFVQPTVVRDISDDSPLVREETFGPIRALLRYDNLDEAVERANGTQYGLGNSVWGTDTVRAAEVAAQLESGTVWVNTHFAVAPDVPFGGWKQSGAGVEFGLQGLLEYTRTQVINVNKA